MKKIISKIPLIGPLAIRIKKKLNSKKFGSTEKYWINRYKNGGNSGKGSYDEFAEYKGEVINNFVKENNVQTVIELGCGDGNQVSYFDFPFFTGFEVSADAVEMCRKKFESDKTRTFFLLKDFSKCNADLTLSLDVVYCLVEDETYEFYMNLLFDSSDKYVVVYSSNHDKNNTPFPHIKHRKFTEWVASNKPQFKLISHLPNKFAEKVSKSSNSEWYIFEK